MSAMSLPAIVSGHKSIAYYIGRDFLSLSREYTQCIGTLERAWLLATGKGALAMVGGSWYNVR